MNDHDQAMLLLAEGVVVGDDGEPIGRVGQVFVDSATGRPTWVTVRTGWFGTRETFVPLEGALLHGEEVRVPFDRDTVRRAPHHEAAGELSAADEDELYSYYGTAGRSDGAPDGDVGNAGERLAEDGARYSDQHAGGIEVTRSAEQLHVGVTRVAARRARLHKFVLTQEQTVPVRLARQEARLVREPVTEGTAEEVLATARPVDDAYSVVLMEDMVVVTKEVVPVERITMTAESVSEVTQVSAAVRAECVELTLEPSGTVAVADSTAG